MFLPSFMGFDKAGFGDPDAAAFFARVTAAGGTLTATEQTAVNTLVVTMKANSLWTLQVHLQAAGLMRVVELQVTEVVRISIQLVELLQI